MELTDSYLRVLPKKILAMSARWMVTDAPAAILAPQRELVA